MIHPLLGAIGVATVVILIALGVISDWLTREPRRASSDAYKEANALFLAAEQNKESVGAFSIAPSLTEPSGRPRPPVWKSANRSPGGSFCLER